MWPIPPRIPEVTNNSFFFPLCRCGVPADTCVLLDGPEPVPWVPVTGKGSPLPISVPALATLVE